MKIKLNFKKSMNFIAHIIIATLLATFLVGVVFAENATNNTAPQDAATSTPPSGFNLNQETGSTTTTTGNGTTQETLPAPKPTPIEDFTILSITPEDFKVGYDTQINIQVQNTGNVDLKNILAAVSGRGFAMVDVTPIDSLKPGEKSYVLVKGLFREVGFIPLIIKISGKEFLFNVRVSDPAGEAKDAEQKRIQAEEKAKKDMLANLSAQVDELAKNVSALEILFDQKKSSSYDVSDIDLNQLKGYVKDAQASLISQNIEQTTFNIRLATTEYATQKNKLDIAKIITKSWSDILKENAVLISTLAGAIVALFTVSELLKKKKDALAESLKEKKASEKKSDKKKAKKK